MTLSNFIRKGFFILENVYFNCCHTSTKMSFTTIYRTSRRNRTLIIKSILGQHNIKHRLIKESHPANFKIDYKVQVREEDRSKAFALLKENGFLTHPTWGNDGNSLPKYWVWLVFTILALIMASFLINLLWR